GGERYWDVRHGTKLGDFSGGYLKGLRILGVRVTPSLVGKLLFREHDIVIKCITGRFALPVSYIAARLRGKPFILWTNLWYHPLTLFHRLSRPITTWIYRHADAVVAFGSHVEVYLVEGGVSPERIFISTQAVDSELFGRRVTENEKQELRAKLAAPEEKIVLYVGRFDPIKGLDDLVRAFTHVSRKIPAKLVLVGEGETKEGIQNLVSELGLHEDVVFESYISNSALPEYYAVADVLVLPSITLRGVKEVWGLVINEAMNQGCPVVATDAVGAVVGGLVQHGKTGIVVQEQNSEVLASALETLLADKDAQKRMRLAATEEIARWTYERQVKGFVEAIEHVRNKSGAN
ncbi:MAG: glycosyltransferase family 4 protein, partial [Bacteroidota bacterium]